MLHANENNFSSPEREILPKLKWDYVPSGASAFQYGLGILATHSAKLCEIEICGDGRKPANFSLNCAVGGYSACSFGNCWCDACLGEDTGRDAIDNFKLIHGDNVADVSYAIGI